MPDTFGYGVPKKMTAPRHTPELFGRDAVLAILQEVDQGDTILDAMKEYDSPTMKRKQLGSQAKSESPAKRRKEIETKSEKQREDDFYNEFFDEVEQEDDEDSSRAELPTTEDDAALEALDEYNHAKEMSFVSQEHHRTVRNRNREIFGMVAFWHSENPIRY
jgi:hypothetical protein